MTEMLEKAISQMKQLPETDQDAMAHLILEELESERRWDASFAHPKSPLLLEKPLLKLKTNRFRRSKYFLSVAA